MRTRPGAPLTRPAWRVTRHDTAARFRKSRGIRDLPTHKRCSLGANENAAQAPSRFTLVLSLPAFCQGSKVVHSRLSVWYQWVELRAEGCSYSCSRRASAPWASDGMGRTTRSKARGAAAHDDSKGSGEDGLISNGAPPGKAPLQTGLHRTVPHVATSDISRWAASRAGTCWCWC